MSCCNCPIQPCPSRYATWLPRIGFGLMLIGFGVSHFRDLTSFIAMSKSPFSTVPPLAMVAGILAYAVPVLQIVGGALFATKLLSCLSKVCILASLGGIMGWAGVGMMVAPTADGMQLGSAFQGALVTLIGYWVIKKMSCCSSMSAMKCAPGSACCTANSCPCGKGGACACGTK